MDKNEYFYLLSKSALRNKDAYKQDISFEWYIEGFKVSWNICISLQFILCYWPNMAFIMYF
jgi:hypothetical protein